MARSAVLSNGRLAVALDEKGFVNDFYYPYVGLDNMTSARFVHHKIGVWVDGSFYWLDHPTWHTESKLDDTAMVARVNYVSDELELSIVFRDFVSHEYDFFGRVAIIENRSDREREVRMFFHQVFQISDAGRTDTGIYTPGTSPYILAYSGDTSFVIGLRTDDGEGFDQFSIGNYGIEGKAGTYMDAEDGNLSGNTIEHGGVDSVIRATLTIAPKHARHLDYWVCASKANYHYAAHIHRNLFKNGLYHYLGSTTQYWKTWLSKAAPFIDSCDVEFQPLIRRSLLTVKAHCDERGGVIASLDSSIYNYGRDYYSYVWPRDSFYALMPLLKLGYLEEVEAFLTFTLNTIHPRGYVHHKYNPDGSLGSTWHPLVQNGVPELNIQEDETASVVLLALEYIRMTSSESIFAKKLIKSLLIPGANFMSEYIDTTTGLPHPSYDLWEQVFITSTYTTSICYKALKELTAFFVEHGTEINIQHLKKASDSIEQNFSKLFNSDKQYFDRGILPTGDSLQYSNSIDISSLFGLLAYSPQSVDDSAVFATATATKEHLINKGSQGGIVRYPGDDYMLENRAFAGNPWIIGTLWYGRYLHATGNEQGAWDSLRWANARVSKAGLLSEQVDPETGELRGVAPLVWSHAEFISTIQAFKGL